MKNAALFCTYYAEYSNTKQHIQQSKNVLNMYKWEQKWHTERYFLLT